MARKAKACNDINDECDDRRSGTVRTHAPGFEGMGQHVCDWPIPSDRYLLQPSSVMSMQVFSRTAVANANPNTGNLKHLAANSLYTLSQALLFAFMEDDSPSRKDNQPQNKEMRHRQQWLHP